MDLRRMLHAVERGVDMFGSAQRERDGAQVTTSPRPAPNKSSFSQFGGSSSRWRADEAKAWVAPEKMAAAAAHKGAAVACGQRVGLHAEALAERRGDGHEGAAREIAAASPVVAPVGPAAEAFDLAIDAVDSGTARENRRRGAFMTSSADGALAVRITVSAVAARSRCRRVSIGIELWKPIGVKRRADSHNRMQRRPGEEVWLVGERRSTGEQKYYVSNLPADASLKKLVATNKARWFCEQAHQQLKEELGLNHFEGRSWTGLHRHALMTMIAYAFLQSRRLKAAGRRKKSRRAAAATEHARHPAGHP